MPRLGPGVSLSPQQTIQVGPQKLSNELFQSLTRPARPAYGVTGGIAALGQPMANALLANVEQGREDERNAAAEAKKQQAAQMQASAMGRMILAAAKAKQAGQSPGAAMVQAGQGMPPGAAPAVGGAYSAALTQMLKPRGAEKLVQIADPNSPTGVKWVPQSQAAGQPAAKRNPLVEINQAPKGYERTETGMRPVPGGPADPETIAKTEQAKSQVKADIKKRNLYPKAQSALNSVKREFDTARTTIDEALKQISGTTTGLVGAASMEIPGTPAFQLARTLDTLKAIIGFSTLQEMRANSPTGGALGQVSERENVLLQSTKGSLDQRQNPRVLRKILTRIKTNMASAQEEKESAFKTDFADFIPKEGAPDTISQPKTQTEYDALPSGALFTDDSGQTKRKP